MSFMMFLIWVKRFEAELENDLLKKKALEDQREREKEAQRKAKLMMGKNVRR